MRKLMVKKFGGTSVGSIEKIEAVADRLVSDRARGERPVVVVSAMSGETDRLSALAHRVHPHSRCAAYDMLLAVGEQVSTALLALALEKRGVKAQPLLAHQAGIYTDSFFSKARIQKISTDKILHCVQKGWIPLAAGFQGMTSQNNITTLGRGGSDTTAVALAAALKQPACEIFTDVPKIYTADPRLLKASQISYLSFEEMMEMSALGSRVLHHRAVELAAKCGIRLHVRSTFETTKGTWILPKEELMETPFVSAVTHDSKTAVIKMVSAPKGTAFMNRLFSRLAKQLISVDIISQSDQEQSQRLAFSIMRDDLHETKKIVYQLLSPKQVFIIDDAAKLSIVGVGMAGHPGAAARFFKVLHKAGGVLHLVTTSEIKISAVIDKSYLRTAARALHQEFGLDKTATKTTAKTTTKAQTKTKIKNLTHKKKA